MLRRYRSSIALVLTVVLASPSSFAAPKPAKPKTVREELPDAARKDWDAARDLLDTSDFAGALVEYQRAYEQSKNPRVLYNVAVCEKNLRHYARARGDASSRSSPTGRGRFRRREETRREGGDPGARSVRLDRGGHGERDGRDAPHRRRGGRADARSTSRSDRRRAARGPPAQGRLRRRRADGDDRRRDSGEGDVRTSTPRSRSPPSASPSPGAPGANVIIDGIDMGQAPFKGEVVAGRHTFEARAPGFVDRAADNRGRLQAAAQCRARSRGRAPRRAPPDRERRRWRPRSRSTERSSAPGLGRGAPVRGAPAHREEARVSAVHVGDHDQRRPVARSEGDAPRGEGGLELARVDDRDGARRRRRDRSPATSSSAEQRSSPSSGDLAPGTVTTRCLGRARASPRFGAR